MNTSVRRIILAVFTILTFASCYFAYHLKFEFYLEQFFPEGDKDLAFFQDFIKDFETDVNFSVFRKWTKLSFRTLKFYTLLTDRKLAWFSLKRAI